MPLTLPQYAEYLDTRQLSWPAPPEVEKAKAKTYLEKLPGIRAVVWSVYGTLLRISGSQLLFEHPDQFIMDVALDKTLQEFKMWASMSRKPGQPAEYLWQLYNKAFDEQRNAPSPGEKHPEIIAELIWENIIKKLLQKDYTFDVSFYGSLNEFSRKVAYFFHASLQGTACYDRAAEGLARVAETGVKQGLLDNGQVFTPVQLERALRQQDPSLEFDKLIDPDLRLFSYQVRARKPSERMFRQLLHALEAKDIGPGEVLYVGNNIDLDIIPARRLGMHTALFAGDRGSLRGNPEQLKEIASRPDLLVTKLSKIGKVLAAS
jgi:FMN phosphatase YigB (HAD superfamily)